MKRKSIFIFATSIILIICFVFGGKQISNMINNKNYSESNDIGQFTLAWISGGAKNQGTILEDGSLLIEPGENSIYNVDTNPSGGIQVTYQLLFNMGGSEDAPPGSIKMYLPKHIFKNRSGNYIEEIIDVPLVLYPEATGSGFNYRYETIGEIEYLVLENYKTIPASYSFDCSITWVAPSPSAIASGYETTIKGDVEIDLDLDGEIDLSSESNELLLKYASKVKAETNLFGGSSYNHNDSSLGTSTNVYTSWQSGWNKDLKPENHEEYVYSLWYSYGSVYYATQPYTVSFEVVPSDELDGEVVGYCNAYNCFASSNYPLKETAADITISNPSSTSDFIGYYCFIVKYPKENILDDEEHILKENLVYTITGIDGDESTIEKSITSKYKGVPEVHEDQYLTPGFEPTRQIKMSHYGSTTYNGTINSMSLPDDSYEFRIGYSNNPPTHSYGMAIDLTDTLKDDGDPENYEDYFVNKWTYNNTVDTFFMGDSSTYELLEPGDFEIRQFYINYGMYSYVNKITETQYTYNTVTIDGWQEEALSYDDYEPAKIYYKNSTGEWIYYASIQKISSNKCNYLLANGTENNNVSCQTLLNLPSGVVGLKLAIESNQYKVDSSIYYYAYGKNSYHVKSIADNKTSLNLYTMNTVYVEDKNGNVYTDFKTTNNGNNLLSTFNALIEDKDNNQYGMKMRHSFSSTAYKKITNGYTATNKWVNYKNDPSNRRIIANYTAYAYEYSSYTSGSMTPEVVFSSGLIKEQKNGTFYDLLPKGVNVDKETLVVQTFNTSYSSSNSNVNMYKAGVDVKYSLSLIDNWNNTGRTMMVIKMSLPEDVLKNYVSLNSYVYSGFSLKFTAYYSWDSIYDYGNSLTNTIAYKSGSGALNNGYADDSTSFSSLTDRELFVDLDKDGNPEGTLKDTVYAQRTMSFSFNTASDSSFEVGVKTTGMIDYDSGKEDDIIASAGGYYNYRLRYASQRNVKTTGLILYDVLENYKDGEIPTWKGKFVGVDVSQPESKNIDPVIYYSTKKNINLYEKGKSVLDNGIPSDADLTNSEIWSTTPPTNLADVTAIAVDLSKMKNGSDSYINSEESVVVGITMQAPYSNYEVNIANDAKALNAAWWSGNTLQGTSIAHQNFSVYEWTRVGLREPQLTILKKSYKESGTESNPRIVSAGDRILYDIVIGLKDTYEAVNNVMIEDDLPDSVLLESDKIGYYIDGEGDIDDYLLSSSSDFTDVSIEGRKVSINIKEVLSGQKIHILIPVYVDKTSINSTIDNVARIKSFNDISSDLESNHTYHAIDTGSIKITKKVRGLTTNKKFNIKITIKPSAKEVDEEIVNTLLNSTFSGVKFTNGVATVSLGNKDSIIIEGLPSDYDYEVLEEDYSQDGYEATYTRASGYIEPYSTIEVEIVNSNFTNPKTSKYIYPIGIIGLLVFFIIMPFNKKKIIKL